MISRSAEVKALGIPMGIPVFKIKDLIQRHGICLLSSNFSLYGDMSTRLMKMLKEFSPSVEAYSIDEAFLDCQGITEDLYEYGMQIRQTVHQWLGLPVGIGIAPTKTLAKIANLFAKKGKSGVCVLEDEKKIKETLLQTPVEDVWGVGRQIAKKLKVKGIYTAFELQQVDPRWMRKCFTVIGERLVRELQGLPCLEVEDTPSHKKSIQVTRSFGYPIRNLAELREAVATYTTKVASKLRHGGLKAHAILVYARTSTYNTEDYFSSSIVITLECPVNDTPTLVKVACQGIEQIYQPKRTYQKAGVIALELDSKPKKQLSLRENFRPQEKEDHERNTEDKKQRLSEAIDRVNKKFGNQTIFPAACGIKPKWMMKSDHRTPAYTTSWAELLKVKA